MVLHVKYSAPTSATMAEQILEDKLECVVCNKCINNEHESVKNDNCGNTCHKMCTNMNDDYALFMVCCTTQENAKQRQSADTSDVLSSSTIDLTLDKSDSSRSKSNTGSVNSVSKSKLEKVQRGIPGEKSSKDMASSRNLGTDSVYVNSADKPAVKTKVPNVGCENTRKFFKTFINIHREG